MESCVYKIRNIVTDKLYVGSAVSGLTKRKRVHISNLTHNKHHSNKLQNSYNKYGEKNFVFEIIEYCPKDILLEKEQYWIDYYDSYYNGYNCTPVAGNCLGRIVSIETKLKISNSLLGVKQPRTKEHDDRLSKARMKSVLQYDINNKLINEFRSCAEAAIKCKVSQSHMSNLCNGIKKHNEYKFKYKKDGEYT